MKIGIIQASSQKSKNAIVEQCLRKAVKDEHEIINFGMYEDSSQTMSYIEIAVCISLLLESHAVDFIVTGCSSGQGMMLACNSLPGVICGYVETVSDAFLFGRINDGNAVSYPLGLNWGWTAEINLTETFKTLFCEPFGQGYPKEDAQRKQKDTRQLKQMNQICKKSMPEILTLLDSSLVSAALGYEPVYQYIMKYGHNQELIEYMKNCKKDR